MRLPLFPLHGVAFPGSTIPLIVFEPRYRALVETVSAGDGVFGVIAIRRGREVGGPAETFSVGCLARIIEQDLLHDQRLSLTVKAVGRFSIDRRLPDDPFPLALVVEMEEIGGDDAATLIPAARAALERYRRVMLEVQNVDVGSTALPQDPVEASFAMARALALDLVDRQRLLEAPDGGTRLALATELARREALLLETVGPSVGRPSVRGSPN